MCTPHHHVCTPSILRLSHTKAVHEFLQCSAQHVCVHQCACSCDPRTNILQLFHLSVVDNIFDKPPKKKIKWGYVWWSWEPGSWSVLTNPTTYKFFIQYCSNDEGRMMKRDFLLKNDMQLQVFNLWEIKSFQQVTVCFAKENGPTKRSWRRLHQTLTFGLSRMYLMTM